MFVLSVVGVVLAVGFVNVCCDRCLRIALLIAKNPRQEVVRVRECMYVKAKRERRLTDPPASAGREERWRNGISRR